MDSNTSSDESHDFCEWDGFVEEEYINYDMLSAEFMEKLDPFRYESKV